MTSILHRNTQELEAGLDWIRQSPKDAGELKLIVRRPEILQREVLTVGELNLIEGWRATTGMYEAAHGRLTGARIQTCNSTS